MSGHNTEQNSSKCCWDCVSIPYMSGHNLSDNVKYSIIKKSQSPICRVIIENKEYKMSNKLKSQSPICRVIILENKQNLIYSISLNPLYVGS